MDYNDLIEDFASRHNVEGLVAVDGAASLDIDGIIVTIVASSEATLVLSAEIGDPPAEGAATFSNLLLEANMGAGAYFARIPEGAYLVVQRLPLPLIDGDSFDAALESFVNNAEKWRRLLADFRPIAKAAAESPNAEDSSYASNGFMQV